MDLDEIVADIANYSGDAMAICHIRDGENAPRIRWVNTAFEEIFGHKADDVVGREACVLHPEAWVKPARQLARSSRSSGRPGRDDVQCLRADGTEFWVSMSAKRIPARDGSGHHIVAVYRDIDELKRSERSADAALAQREALLEELSAAQGRLVAAIDAIPDPFALLDGDGRIVVCNGAFRASVSDNPDAIGQGMDVEDIRRGAVRDDAEDWLVASLADRVAADGGGDVLGAGGHHYRVVRSKVPNGDTVVMRIDLTDAVRRQAELKAYAEDLERTNREIEYKALHDELTGLGNRRFLEIELDKARAHRKAHGGEVAVLHIDLDRFKQVNDTMGHEAGDHVLREVAARLRRIFRQQDAIARVGGDEFLAVIRCTSEDAVPEDIASRVVQALSVPVEFKGRSCRIGASVGVAKTPLADEKDLLINSDIALYEAKNRGRSRTASFDVTLLSEMQANQRLADDILRGLAAGEFVPVYQPQVDARHHGLVGLETLARWRHPTHGILEPRSFLRVAEELDIMREIDRVIFETAIGECRAAFAGWSEPPKLSFNVSARRLQDPALLMVADHIGDYPGPIAFELLESIFVETAPDSYWYQIEMLRDYGISIEIDDFGSSRASLVALTRIAPSRLKIDRRLVAPIAQSRSSLGLAQAIVHIGRSLGIGITAEGVETAEQARILRDLGCDTLQGFHFASPRPLVQLVESMRMPERRLSPAPHVA